MPWTGYNTSIVIPVVTTRVTHLIRMPLLPFTVTSIIMTTVIWWKQSSIDKMSPMTGTHFTKIYEIIIKIFRELFCTDSYTTSLITFQIVQCHISPAVWHLQHCELITSLFFTTTIHIFTRYESWAHKPFVNWSLQIYIWWLCIAEYQQLINSLY